MQLIEVSVPLAVCVAPCHQQQLLHDNFSPARKQPRCPEKCVLSPRNTQLSSFLQPPLKYPAPPSQEPQAAQCSPAQKAAACPFCCSCLPTRHPRAARLTPPRFARRYVAESGERPPRRLLHDYCVLGTAIFGARVASSAGRCVCVTHCALFRPATKLSLRQNDVTVHRWRFDCMRGSTCNDGSLCLTNKRQRGPWTS